jgi:hypothetical protein
MQYSKNSLQLTTISVLRNECYSCDMWGYMLISFAKHICTVMCKCLTLQREIQYI